MRIIGIIPARYASSRFPGKPLANIHGKTMIQHVYEQSTKAKLLHALVVATDDVRIKQVVENFGGTVVMTSTQLPSGTDRCAAALQQLNENYDAVINIQGDEPFISPDQIDCIAKMLLNDGAGIATLRKPITEQASINNPNVVKVVTDVNGKALYFSRSPLPYLRQSDQNHDKWNSLYYKHIGLYGFKTTVLEAITKLPPSVLELAESLEQLRWLENGFTIHTEITETENLSVDTPEDLEKLMNNG